MATFGVRTENKLSVYRFIKGVNDRLNRFDFKRNPFTGYTKIFKEDNDLIVVINMRPIWPNFAPWIAFFSLIPILLFSGPNNPGWLIIPLIFIALSFFWTSGFFYITFKAGLNKAGYKGSIKRLKQTDIINALARRIK